MDPPTNASLDEMLEEVTQAEFHDMEHSSIHVSRVEELESSSDTEEGTEMVAPEVPNDFSKLATAFITDISTPSLNIR